MSQCGGAVSHELITSTALVAREHRNQGQSRSEHLDGSDEKALGDSDHHPPLVNSRWPGGRVASHIYLVGKSTSQKTAFGEFAVTRWPGGRVASHIYLVGKICVSDNELRSIKCCSKASISLLFHCAIAWPPWPPSQMDEHLRRLFSNAYSPKASAEEFAI
jgi:hypothetical protein